MHKVFYIYIYKSPSRGAYISGQDLVLTIQESSLKMSYIHIHLFCKIVSKNYMNYNNNKFIL